MTDISKTEERITEIIFNFAVGMISDQTSLFLGGLTPEKAEKSQGVKIAEAIEKVADLIKESNTAVLDSISRVEVIDETGIAYIKWQKGIKVTQDIQDQGRTLKIFITKGKK